MAAGNAISDGLGAFALGALGKAAGQDFLTPMLDATRQKDLISFQRKAAEDARARERQIERTERAASRKHFLNAMAAVGAIAPEDLVASGGVDALAEMDDSDFAIVQGQLAERRLKTLNDEDLFAATRGRMAAMGYPVPAQMTRSQAIELNSRADMDQLMKKQKDDERQESYNAVNGNIEAAASAVEQMFAQELNITGATVNDAMMRVQVLRAQLKNAEVDPRRRPELEARLMHLERSIAQRGPSVTANQIGSMGPSAQFTAWAEVASKDPQAAQMALNRPGMVANVAAMERNYDALRLLPDSAIANNEPLKAAKAYAMEAQSSTELLKDPAAAYSVFNADVGTASVRAADGEKKQAVKLQAESMLASVVSMGQLGGPWELAAEDVAKISADDLIIGDAGQYDVAPERVVNAVTARLRQAIDHTFLPGREGELFDIQSQLDEMEGTPFGKEVKAMVLPFLKSAQKEMFDRMEPDSYALTDKLAASGVKRMKYGVENFVVRDAKSPSGEAFNIGALPIIEEGAVKILTADTRASRAHLESVRAEHEKAMDFATYSGNNDVKKTATAAERDLLDTEANLLLREQSSGLLMGAMDAIYESGRQSYTRQETVNAVAAKLAASLNKSFTEVGLMETVPEVIATELLAALGKGDSVATATMEYVRTNLQMFAQAAQTKGKGAAYEQELRYRIAEWESVIANLPQVEESKQGWYRKALVESGYSKASLPSDIAVNDYLLGLIARKSR